MTFTDAVKELSGGRCKGIKQLGWSGYLDCQLKHSEKTADGLSWIALSSILNDDWQLVDPLPQTEEVEMVRWMNVHDKGIRTEQEMEEYGYPRDNRSWIKLTGTFTRPVKPKVKRREQTTIEKLINDVRPIASKIFIEWEEEA